MIENVGWHFWRTQAQFANYCEVQVLQPYRPSEAERENPRLYADNVRKLMAAELGAKLSPYGIPEQQMLKRAGYCVDKTGRWEYACRANRVNAPNASLFSHLIESGHAVCYTLTVLSLKNCQWNSFICCSAILSLTFESDLPTSEIPTILMAGRFILRRQADGTYQRAQIKQKT